MSDILTAPYGAWPSPISAVDIARGKMKLGFPTVVGGQVWWEEARPDEGGRVTVMCCDADGNRVDLLPSPWNARTRVHEYGGRSYLPVPSAAGGGAWKMVFASFDDQRLYLRDGGEQRPLTPVPATAGALRYADMVLSPDADELWCVREQHDGAVIRRAIVAIPLDGTAADSADTVRVLVSGADFYAFPTPSPDGRKLAWICWNHPRMPWDGTELWVAPVGDLAQGELEASTLLMGGPAESVLAPAWRDEDSLYAISDASGWWNLHLADIAGSPPRPLCPREEEFAAPLWQLGGRPFAVLGDGRLAVLHGLGELSLGVLDQDSGVLDDLGLPHQVFQPALAASGMTIAGVAGDPQTPWSVVQVNVGGPARVLRQEAAAPDAAYLPSPQQIQLSGAPNEAVVHALVYPPSSPVAKAPDGELPPYIVWAHGGPTACSVSALDLEKVFFTSRGIGVIDVNYGGSSGYGRAYRERLRGQWGVVDVADAMTAALALVGDGEADGTRLGIRGASAGAWTALVAVTSAVSLNGRASSVGSVNVTPRQPVFAVAVSYFGVTDRRLSAATTHDFESSYLEGLIGPLPEAEARYVARSPRGHVSSRTCPVLLLQGLDNPVVVPEHADLIARELAEHHIPYAHLAFPGEAHGFRKAETIIASLEAELSFYGQIMGFTPPRIQPIALSERIPPRRTHSPE